jgi:diguanylate cyclase (GGDEF)-like protein
MGNAAGGMSDNLPGWLLEFHAISLRELCRKCLNRLPAYLGFADVSMYLHDPEKGILTLAGTTHTRPIDLAVRVGGDNTHLMVAVARSGKLLATDRVATERRHRAVRRPDGEPRYPDGSCLVAPLVAGGQLWGVLNFTSRQRKLSPNERLALPAVFDFIAKSLRYARAHHRAQTQARIDPLTGLYNRRWVLETLTKEVRRGQRFATPLSVVVADLDGLKAVNDTNGHMAGDCLLRHVAGRITSRLRQFDSAARIGGDEFVMLLPATDIEGARTVARRILEAIRSDSALFRGVPLPIRASLGVAQWQPDWDAAHLLEAADQAMYQAKQQGRDQVVCRPAPVDVRLPTACEAQLQREAAAAADPRTGRSPLHDDVTDDAAPNQNGAIRLPSAADGRTWPAPAPTDRPPDRTPAPSPEPTVARAPVPATDQTPVPQT